MDIIGGFIADLFFLVGSLLNPILSGDLSDWGAVHYLLVAFVVVGGITIALKRS